MTTTAMGYLIRLLAILLGWTVVCSDGTVTVSAINSVDGGNELECDTEVTLVCRIDPYANLINWVINGTLYAMCSPLCSDNPPFPGNYSFSFDIANGIFNTTINQVTFGDSSTTFKCDDGSDFDDITTEVIPAYSRNVTNVDSNDEEYQLVFTTACVHPDVEFTWYSVKGNNTGSEVYKTDQNKSEDINSCALDSKCGGTGTVKVSSTVSVKKVSDGEEGFLEVVVKYKNPEEERTFRFNEKFVFEDNPSNNENACSCWCCPCSQLTVCIVAIISSILGFIVLICIACIAVVITRRKVEPDPPTEFTLIDGSVTETCIGFKWKSGFDGGSPQTFMLTYEVNGQVFPSSVKDSGQDQMQHTLRDLSKGTYYSVTIFAQNSVGKSSLVDPLYVRTKGQPDPPTEFTLIKESVTITNITFQWKSGSNGGYPQTFILTDRLSGRFWQLLIKVTEQAQMKHTLTDLSIGTDYSFEIHAENEKGKSSAVGPLHVRIKDKPSPPTEFKFIDGSVTKTSITFQWMPGCDGGDTQTFILTCTPNRKDKPHTIIGTGQGQMMRHTLHNLSEGTYYSATIFAKNKLGKSSLVGPLSVRTKGDGVPYQPTDFRIIKVTKSSVTVQWKPGNNGGYDQKFIFENLENERVVTIKDKHDPIMSYEFQKLSLTHNYKLIICAINEKGSTPPVSVWTKSKPKKPWNFNLDEDSVTESSIYTYQEGDSLQPDPLFV